MRNLTIKRDKSFVGCLAKMKVYIEDQSFGDTMINDVMCRKLGTLKNGEECTYQIDERAARVYVIADKLTKNYCNDYYTLPDGGEDVYLVGANAFNPANGNAFRFYNNNSEEVTAARRKGGRIGLIVLIAAIFFGVCAGVLFGNLLNGDGKPESKTFSVEGMNITLTDEFEELEDSETFTSAYDSRNVAVFTLREPFTIADGLSDYTLEQYGETVIENNELTSSELKLDRGLLYFDYAAEVQEANETFRYYAYTYKSDDAFWLVQFAVPDKNAEELFPQISDWAHTVSFDAEVAE